MNPRHELQTPTFALSSIGYLALAVYAMRKLPGSDWAAFVCLGASAGGVAMALGSEVERKGEEWGWRGLYRALRRPSKTFVITFLAHLPQLVTAAWLAFYWRRWCIGHRTGGKP